MDEELGQLWTAVIFHGNSVRCSMGLQQRKGGSVTRRKSSSDPVAANDAVRKGADNASCGAIHGNLLRARPSGVREVLSRSQCLASTIRSIYFRVLCAADSSGVHFQSEQTVATAQDGSAKDDCTARHTVSLKGILSAVCLAIATLATATTFWLAIGV